MSITPGVLNGADSNSNGPLSLGVASTPASGRLRLGRGVGRQLVPPHRVEQTTQRLGGLALIGLSHMTSLTAEHWTSPDRASSS
jgi:hypothetical protein